MVLFIHHRYRVPGGEERAVADLADVVRDELGEPVTVMQRDSTRLSAATAAAGLLGGGLRPDQVGAAVRQTGARIVHAHNLHPTLGWRALAAARDAGARVVLHLHQYRLVCAIGVCFRDGHECTECHATNTLPGVRHGCRGSVAEAVTYGAALALWQRRLLAQADAVVVPSVFARDRLQQLGVSLPDAFVVPNPVREVAPAPAASAAYTPAAPAPAPAPAPAAAVTTFAAVARSGALVVSRLSPEKGVDVAIDACARAGLALTIAGDGPERAALQARAAAAGASVTFLGHVPGEELARLRAAAAVAVVPSRSAETFGLAAAEAMAAGLPVAASRIGALPELVPDGWLAPPGDAEALAALVVRLAADSAAPDIARAQLHERAAPAVTATALRAAYAAAVA